ncbi:MAG: acyl-ACP desaturase [Candidatus Eisenbacteria bacterium]
MTVSSLAIPHPHQIEVLDDLEEVVFDLIEAHEAKRRLWWPSDLVGPPEGEDPDRHFAELRERARGIPDAVRISLVMGLLTEEGLPQFHRLIAQSTPDRSQWRVWNNVWTAEEDRHGALLHDYLWEARIVQPRIVEEMQFAYLKTGYDPDWQRNPYQVFAYTSMQERATQVAHQNNAKRAGEFDPLIARGLERIGAEEARHFHFYRQVFAEVLQRDANGALTALARALSHFEMPGGNIPAFDDMTDVIRRADLYGPRHFLKIVQELIEYWRLNALTDLDAAGRKAQEFVLKYPARLERIADHLESRTRPKSFTFSLVGGRSFTVG